VNSETIAVYFKNQAQQINTLKRLNAKFRVKPGGTHSNHL